MIKLNIRRLKFIFVGTVFLTFAVSSIFQGVYKTPNSNYLEDETNKIHCDFLPTFDEKDYQNILNNLNSITPKYYYENFYLNTNDIKRLKEKVEDSKKVAHIVTIKDIDKIIELIKNETTEFVAKNSKFENIFDKTNLNFTEILQEILEEFTNNTNDIDEDFCHISDLIIVNQNLNKNILGLYDHRNNLIALDINKIYSLEGDFTTNLKKSLYHELNHARQVACSHTKGNITSISYLANETTTIAEASAEEDTLRNGNFSIKNVYYDERKDQYLILLLALFKNDVKIEDYFNVIFDSNVKGLWDFLDLKTNQDLLKFYNIMYGIDAKNNRTPLSKDLVVKNPEFTYRDLIEEVGYGYRNELFKLVLARMVSYTYNNSGFTLKDNMALFYIIKTMIIDNTSKIKKTGEDYKYYYDKNFTNVYFELEDTYYNFLTEYYCINREELQDLDSEIWEYVTSITNSDSDYYKDRFPLLKDIISLNNFSKSYYDSFLNYNGIELSRHISK